MIRRFFVVFMITCICQTSWAQGDHITFGIGPSFIYGDNSGEYSSFKFKVLPAVSLSINKQITENITLRGSLGVQMINSGDYEDYDGNNIKKLIRWGDQDQAFGYKGTSYFADVMPFFMTNPNEMGMLMSTFQFYAGLGLGVMLVNREQDVLKNGIATDNVLTQGDIVTYKETNVLPYIPTRIGLSTNSGKDWDLGIEFVLLTTLNSELDGNNIKDKTLSPDMSSQILITIKRYIGKSW